MNKIRNVRVHPRIAVILKVLIGVGLIVALVLYIDVDALRQSVLHANIVYLIIGAVLVVANTRAGIFALALFGEINSQRDIR